MAAVTYTWDLQNITIAGNGSINFTSGVTTAVFTEDDANVADETTYINALSGTDDQELPYKPNVTPAERLAEVFGDADDTGASNTSGATSPLVGLEYVTIDGVDYDYTYLGYETFPYTAPDGSTGDDYFAIIEIAETGDYYALNLTNAGDPDNGRTGVSLGTLIQGPLFIQDNVVQPPCFTAGTQILAEFSETSIEDLSVGDRVWTMDHGLQKIRWIGSKHLTGLDLVRAEHLRPILIKAGALGKNYPETDLKVSPQHRIYVRSAIAERMFGSSEVLVAAKQLLGLPDIDYVNAASGVTYYHILFDRHEVVFANGAFAESFYTGTQALNAIEESSKQEIFEIFPELRETEAGVEGGFDPARPFVAGKNARALAQRHVKNGKPLVETEKRV